MLALQACYTCNQPNLPKVCWAFHNLAIDEPPYAAVKGHKSKTLKGSHYTHMEDQFYRHCH